MAKAQTPLRRLPHEVRDKPVTSPLAQIPLHRRNGIWAKGDVIGLSWTSRGSRHNGIWA